MSKILEVVYDCGYVARFPVTRQPDKASRHTYELTADTQHAQRCPVCGQENFNEEEPKSTS